MMKLIVLSSYGVGFLSDITPNRIEH